MISLHRDGASVADSECRREPRPRLNSAYAPLRAANVDAFEHVFPAARQAYSVADRVHLSGARIFKRGIVLFF